VNRPDGSLDIVNVRSWSGIAAGTLVRVVKLAPGGEEAARYPGRVVSNTGDGWLVVRATWTYRLVEMDGLAFFPGDDLLEWFSPAYPFNAFAVLTPGRRLRGWYANVTYPAQLDVAVVPPLLTWHDLYVDLVGLPDGSYTIRDDDELAASGLPRRDPTLYEQIVTARAELIERFERRASPFAADLERLVAAPK
jgi:hypothetical protein